MLARIAKTGLFLALLIAIGGALLWWDAQRFLDAPLSDQAGKHQLVLEPGATARGLARSLHERGLLDRSWYFTLYARFSGLAARMQAGEYQIDSTLTPRELLALLVSGRVVQHAFTLIEGWNFHELMQALRGDGVLVQTLPNDAAPERVMAALGFEKTHPEGRFLPDTYHFPRGTNDVQFLQRAHRAMQAYLAEQWGEREENLPLESPDEALILASIVEKETGAAEERPLIAGVFVNRLRKGMKLQTDPTVIYGIGPDFDGNIRRRDLRRDTPYNTYTRYGLPPTPIAMPGRAAIRAALHPEKTDALYFVARGDGTHKFSATLAEHEAAVIKYQLGGNASRLRRGGG